MTTSEAVSRELVRALLPEVEPATLALDLAAALRPRDTLVAQRTLDAAGFPSLAPEIPAELSTAAASGLDVDGNAADLLIESGLCRVFGESVSIRIETLGGEPV